MLAVEYCHKALDKERQDPFTIQLLEMSLSALALDNGCSGRIGVMSREKV